MDKWTDEDLIDQLITRANQVSIISESNEILEMKAELLHRLRASFPAEASGERPVVREYYTRETDVAEAYPSGVNLVDKESGSRIGIDIQLLQIMVDTFRNANPGTPWLATRPAPSAEKALREALQEYAVTWKQGTSIRTNLDRILALAHEAPEEAEHE